MATYIVVGTVGNIGNINYLGAQILLDFINEQVYIPFVLKWTNTTADQGEEMITVKIATIRHLRPFVTE